MEPGGSSRGPEFSGSNSSSRSDVDFRLLFESAPGLYLVLTPAFQVVAVSDSYLRATMTNRAEILNRSIFDVFPDNPDDLHATGVRNLRDSLKRVVELKTADAMAVQKYDIRRPESVGGGFEERYWSPVNYPVFSANKDVIFIIHRVEDVTEFIRMKQRGVENERLLIQMSDQNSQMDQEVFLRAQEIQEVNRQLRDAKGQLEERVRDRTEELARANDALRMEIEQSKRLEEQFRRAQKMEAFGQLAGGIAHDFNNLLTAINGFSDMMLSGIIPLSDHDEYLREIRKAGERAASLTRQLLAFSRRQVLQPVSLNLNDLLEEMGKLLHRLIGADIDLRMVRDPKLGYVKADAGQIEQVILNLVVNARDSMPTGGFLTIETCNVDLDLSFTRMRPEIHPGHFVLLAVTDTGIGMDPATKAKIFEPFFTTKEVGKGTGLGLAVVHGIIKQSGGTIEVYSEPGYGTSMKVYLPRLTDPGELSRPATSVAPIPTGSETILLVDDEEIVRETARIALESAGYTVLVASDGDGAMHLCLNHPEEIHLLLNDVVMPRVSGRQLVDLVRKQRQNIKVLFMSGYTDDAILRHGIQSGVAFLQKPLTALALCRKVREVLGS